MHTNTTNPMRFLENPYDLETLFESLSLASKKDKELIFMDRFIALIRINPTIELTTLNYIILTELDIMEKNSHGF